MKVQKSESDAVNSEGKRLEIILKRMLINVACILLSLSLFVCLFLDSVEGRVTVRLVGSRRVLFGTSLPGCQGRLNAALFCQRNQS